jgi:glycosyltransferase involved in cell wall biosynthesis
VIKNYRDQIKWHTGPNRGVCAAWNAAFSLSKSEFVQFLDADDILLREKNRIQKKFKAP